jgi:hypothetical protein
MRIVVVVQQVFVLFVGLRRLVKICVGTMSPHVAFTNQHKDPDPRKNSGQKKEQRDSGCIFYALYRCGGSFNDSDDVKPSRRGQAGQFVKAKKLIIFRV